MGRFRVLPGYTGKREETPFHKILLEYGCVTLPHAKILLSPAPNLIANPNIGEQRLIVLVEKHDHTHKEASLVAKTSPDILAFGRFPAIMVAP
eukprot:1368085-Amorphochlora_amoeboformis.AAC.1